jgi:hypothetical protein
VKRKIALALAGLTTLGTVGVGTVALTAPAEAAGNPSCATRAEFRQIHRGMTVRRTQNIIGSRGRVTIAGSWLSQRQWNVCNSRWGVVTLTYANGRLDNKIMFA